MVSFAAGTDRASRIDFDHHFEFAFETSEKEIYTCNGGCGVASCRAKEVFWKH
jgi:hypothetical protein